MQDGPLQKVVDVVGDDEAVVFAGELDEGVPAGERGGDAGGVGGGGDHVDDVLVALAVGAGGFVDLVLLAVRSFSDDCRKKGGDEGDGEGKLGLVVEVRVGESDGMKVRNKV